MLHIYGYRIYVIATNYCKQQAEYYLFMYLFVWVDQREKQGDISDLSLKRGIHLDVSWENDPFDLYLIHKPYSDQLTKGNLAFFI